MRGRIVVVAGSRAAGAQEPDFIDYAHHPELYATIQDTMHILRVQGGATIPKECFAPAYIYTMSYDSLGRVEYTFTECRRNDALLTLSRWINHRVVNAEQVLLSFNSTTVPFTCHAGDTISFFRDLTWLNPTTGVTGTQNYFALDSLDYAVELVRMSDSLRAVQLDSIGVLDSPAPGRPRIHGTRPLMARVSYTVPPELEGEQVFIRVLVYHRGAGNYWFIRRDELTMCWSKRLDDPDLQEWVRRVYGPQQSKRSVEELSQAANPPDAWLTVEQAVTLGDVTIGFPSAPQGRTVVAVYDALGNLIFYPYVTPGSSGDLRARYHFEKSGAYLIALMHDGRLVATKKVTIAL